jgi:hypothetical protein
MNKLFFLMLLFGFGGLLSIGILGPDFALIAQKLGIFYVEDAGFIVVGCDCVDSETGAPVSCDPALDTYLLCVPDPPP